jgi:hypothetical protein
MKRIQNTLMLVTALVAAAVGSRAYGQEYYLDGDSAYQVVPSDTKIVIQLDSTKPAATPAGFFLLCATDFRAC